MRPRETDSFQRPWVDVLNLPLVSHFFPHTDTSGENQEHCVQFRSGSLNQKAAPENGAGALGILFEEGKILLSQSRVHLCDHTEGQIEAGRTWVNPINNFLPSQEPYV